MKLVDWFAALSAIATAVAAFAAWKAASAAQKQSFDTGLSTRRQTYKTHSDSFNEWLDGIEAEFKVKFFRRYELYDSIFPNNRNPDLEFSEVGSVEVEAWRNSFESLVSMACRPARLHIREVEGWAADHMFLAGHMRYSYLDSSAVQLFFDDSIPSGLSLENYQSSLGVMGAVLTGLSKFSFRGDYVGSRGFSKEFNESFIGLINQVANESWHQHSYRPGK
ncbi:hypothetical protein [Pseudomonas sp. BC42]|uniref:hypothetical protein n=1 Tax=Pseudomonas sp. BC42 TaxID=2933816 RepID=UPI001F21CA36|nr:hypothetical protein [Pseudomonas sp. BC42]ULT72983.1 hypothetical protein L1O02_11650 [Pseudomonas sp. BC42]